MEKRFFLFILLASAIMLGNALLMQWMNPPPPAKPKAAQQQPAKPAEVAQQQPAEEKPDPAEARPAAEEDEQAIQTDLSPQWITLGSLDSADPYRMLVTLTNLGAAVERIELSSEQLRDLEEEGGYLGHLALEPAEGRKGAVINVVGKGTPAAQAGLQPGDIITLFNETPVKDPFDVRSALRATRPGQQASLQIQRNGEQQTVSVTLGQVPLEVVRPESQGATRDPLSLLFTLHQLGDREISRDLGMKTREPESGSGAEVTELTAGGPAVRATVRVGDVITSVDQREVDRPSDLEEILRTTPVGMRLVLTILRDGQQIRLPVQMPSELNGFDLRDGAWELESHDISSATFRRRLPNVGLELVKRYRLAKADEKAAGRDYHLAFGIEIRNIGGQDQELAYQLDGPTGLPIEGWWYASKISRTMSGVGVRDVAVYFRGDDPELISATSLAGDQEIRTRAAELPLVYAAVDAQYVAAALLPQHATADEQWLSGVVPLRVGPVPADKNRRKLVNTSFRLVSEPQVLKAGSALKHDYVFFAGPKRPELLALYDLDELVYYGWFGWVARPMLAILHFFYALVHNYGLAIIMLTILVRGCMFPLSRKQAISAQKMQELQPELKKIAEKYKNNLEQRNKAQQELFRKHNYNPLGGCGLMFIQLPIFIGLYRSLMVDVELRQAPLIPGLRWCSNLAAPDMLFRWEGWLPAFLADETGWLGPYFNLLPIVTIGLFLWQQKMFMPPATDEQTAMQQKMIKYMMIFMGVLFFKVASGLCIYFIASSLWGITERKLLPKTLAQKPAAAESVPAARAATPTGNGSATRARKKQRGGK